MLQISEHVFCDRFIAELELPDKVMPHPYKAWPFLIIENFLSPATLAEIVSYVSECDDVQKAEIKSTLHQSVVVPSVDSKVRKTFVYKLPAPLQELYDHSFLHVQKEIEAYFSLALTTATKVQLLQYKTGFFYIKHADDSSELIDAQGKTIGFKQVAPLRKLTTVLFATSHSEDAGTSDTFTGGELVFNYFTDRHGRCIALKPKAGDLVVFPSNPVYSHEVRPVKSGNRITLVQWHNAIVT